MYISSPRNLFENGKKCGIVLGGGLILLLSKKQKMPKMELFNMNYREPKK
jgi:hypothetical protein